MGKTSFITFILVLLLSACGKKETILPDRYLFRDEPFLQEYSIKYYLTNPNAKPVKVVCDRNGYIQVLSTAGLLKPIGGMLLNPGTLEPDNNYRFFSSTNILVIQNWR